MKRYVLTEQELSIISETSTEFASLEAVRAHIDGRTAPVVKVPARVQRNVKILTGQPVKAKRVRRTKDQMLADRITAAAKPKRKRRTRAEMEAARAAVTTVNGNNEGPAESHVA